MNEDDVDVTRRTALGTVRGWRRDGVQAFLGLPYATIPVRFRAPVPASPWDGVLDAFSDLAPALIITGEMDPLHQSAEHFAGDVANAGVRVRTIRHRGCMHDSVAHVGHIPQGEACALATVAELGRLRPGTPEGDA